MAIDLAVVALLITWFVVIPYLLLFPPRLAFIHTRLAKRSETKAVSRAKVKKNWIQQPSGNLVIPKGRRAVVALVNPKSGGQLGKEALSLLTGLLSPQQVYDVTKVDTDSLLATMSGDIRLVVCGGDGTVGWVMNSAAKANRSFPVGVVPFGTGNDLARTFGWGGGRHSVSTADLTSIIAKTMTSPIALLDRWKVTIVEPKTGRQEVRIMCNYFSFGVDAEISHRFHTERQNHPERFTSQAKNVIKYAQMGFEASVNSKPLNDCAVVAGDGKVLPLQAGWKGCIISNVPCYHGGADFWGQAEAAEEGSGFTTASCSDGRLEVMSLAGTFHIGLVDIGIDSAMRLAQCRKLTVTFRAATACQIDGEPWIQDAGGMLQFERLDQCPVVTCSATA